ncbi:TPA: methyltransferase domain-containing protein [Candidatus Micrarchaeota archaeon]|nr:methyltransferase domain-containing protein [Candidatus Micrarchaeota archaeon]
MAGEDELNYLTFTRHRGNFISISEILLEKRTKYQKMVLGKSYLFGRCLFLDDILQISEMDEPIYHEMLVHPGAVSSEGPLKNALILGGGDGCAMRELLKHKSLEKAVMVDIDADVVQVAREKLKDINKGSLDDSRTEVIIGDATEYVNNSSDNKFDLVILDLVDATGEMKFFGSEEFLSKCASLLAPGGVLVTHGSYLFDFPYVCGMYGTLKKVFRYVRMNISWMPSFGQCWGFLVCSNSRDPASIPLDEVKSKTEGMELLCYMPKHHASFLTLSPFDLRIVENYDEGNYSKEQMQETSKFTDKIEK